MSSLQDALADALGREVVALRPLSGGDLNEAFAAELDGGGRAFVKTRPGAAAGEYESEADGLRWLGEPGALSVPDVLAVRTKFLALSWIEPGRLSRAGEEKLGRGLALTHRAGAPAFGGDRPLRLGPLELPNRAVEDWPSFYAEQRLLALLPRAGLSSRGVRVVEAVCERLEELAGPAESPARLHGDLWPGNVLAGADGCPWLIDPAAYGGHREIDLAMLSLFGGASERILAAYDDAWPRAAGHEDRVALWQLFPLLVHAVLFGGSYVAAVERTACRYV